MNFPAGQGSSGSQAVAAGVVVVLLVMIILAVGTALIVVFLMRRKKSSAWKSRLWFQSPSWSDNAYTCIMRLSILSVLVVSFHSVMLIVIATYMQLILFVYSYQLAKGYITIHR